MLRKCISILLLICSVSVVAQTPQDSLTKSLSGIAASLDAAGMSVVVVKNDKIIYSQGFGKRNIEQNLPVDSKTIYRIASISKSFVATSIMQLCEQRKMSLTDDIGTLLGYSVRNPNYPNDPITVSMLLTHTSSLTDNAGYGSISSLKSSAAFANRKPGTYFQYCNLGFSTLGAIIEKISNQRFDVYVREHILIPLGMNASYNIDDFAPSDFSNISVLYRKSGGSWVPQADNYNGIKPYPRDLSNYKMGEDCFIFSPTGGVRTSAEDLAKFMMAHMKNGVYNGVRVLSDSSAASMHSPKWIYNGSNGANDGFWNKYGYAFQTAETLIPAQKMVGVPGEAYGLLSDMYYSPDSLYGIVFITNGGSKFSSESNGFYNIENAVFNAVYNILIKPAAQNPVSDKRLNETFDSGVPPQGWKSMNLDGSDSFVWSVKSTAKPSNTGTPTNVARIGYTSSGYLITKKVLVSDTGKILAFDYRKFCGARYSSKMEVMVSAGASQADIKSFESIAAYTRSNGRPAYSGSDATPSEWQSALLDMSKYLNQEIYIAFRVDNTYDDGSGAANTGDIWDLDDVRLIKVQNTAVADDNRQPRDFSLIQNYPNPFNPVTTIKYTLPQAVNISLKLFNQLGQEVMVLENGYKDCGAYEIKLNAEDLSSGIYLYRLEAGSFSDTKKLTILK
ncbi:MAG: serine hydrolase [Syntrophothermus sp.]